LFIVINKRGCTRFISGNSLSKKPIPLAADREPFVPVVVVPVHFRIVVVQVAVPGVRPAILRGRPEVGVVANIVERAVVIAVATRKG